MKQYHLYVFTQETVLLAIASKYVDHLETLTDAEKSELDFVPLKTPEGERTALAEELSVELSPTSGCRSRDCSVRLRPRHGIRVLRP